MKDPIWIGSGLSYSSLIRVGKMKKYISAILINALLFQFAGCYTQREITYDEF